MPKRYEAMRDKFKSEGLTMDEAQEKAAKIYNSSRKRNEPKLSSSHKAKRKRG